MATPWNEANVALLAKEWREGVSSFQIARDLTKLGPVPINRNAVARKRHRIGLPPRTGEVKRLAESFAGRRSPGSLYSWRRGTGHLPNAEVETAKPLAGSQPRPWTERGFGECCFPVGGEGADLMSCCLPTGGIAAYCAGHRQTAQAPQTPIRKRIGAAA